MISALPDQRLGAQVIGRNDPAAHHQLHHAVYTVLYRVAYKCGMLAYILYGPLIPASFAQCDYTLQTGCSTQWAKQAEETDAVQQAPCSRHLFVSSTLYVQNTLSCLASGAVLKQHAAAVTFGVIHCRQLHGGWCMMSFDVIWYIWGGGVSSAVCIATDIGQCGFVLSKKDIRTAKVIKDKKKAIEELINDVEKTPSL